MVVDFHTHAFPEKLAEKAMKSLIEGIDNAYPPVSDGTLAGLLANMDRWDIGKSVLQPVITKQSQFVGTNEWAAGAASERFIPFGGLYPNAGSYREDIDFIRSLGLKGIKLHPEYQDFRLDDPEMLKIYDYALDRGLILLFHAGVDWAYKPPYRSDPRMFARVLDAMKGGVIVAAHLGGHAQWDDVERYLAGRDIYLDTSMGFGYYSKEQFLRIVRAHGADRILFGSDAPWSDAGREIETLRSLPLSEAEKSAILGANALRLLMRE